MSASPRACVSALVAMAALALALSACGGAAEREREARGPQPETRLRERSGWTTYQDAHWGYGVGIPDTWHRAPEPMTKLTDPREILSLATFPLHYQPTNCDAFGGAARSDLGRDDLFLIVQERGYDHARGSDWPDFPPRPEPFGPTEPERGEDGCGDPPGTTIHWRNFTDAGRHFHTLVAIGPEAPSRTRDQAWQILDSLRLDPERKPTWPDSG